MANLNRVTVMGVLGRDPETKNFPNGGSVTNFSVATTEHWKDKTTGERKEATEWHRISTNNRLAEIASQYLKKGSKVYIEGSLRTRKWKDQSGADREVTEIKADVLQLL
ncbi:single-stranded DNA-binding protein [Acinetobacter towneri]|nr:single-stranded DNA-binding protein [Acinetobacter towneri]